jgi:hypothetical protein
MWIRRIRMWIWWIRIRNRMWIRNTTFFPFAVLSHPLPLEEEPDFFFFFFFFLKEPGSYLCDAPPLDLPDGGGDDEWNSSLLPLRRLLDGRLEEACRQRKNKI